MDTWGRGGVGGFGKGVCSVWLGMAKSRLWGGGLTGRGDAGQREKQVQDEIIKGLSFKYILDLVCSQDCEEES